MNLYFTQDCFTRAVWWHTQLRSCRRLLTCYLSSSEKPQEISHKIEPGLFYRTSSFVL
ncbi:rCG19932 [Rattus norvegicus]|uniref:RCG19932 n=1 Tax=Rattus norvegicus TaxID=10116 RepID=A6KTD6_RAT|nr:rCG19932 [Rattus norvegicus]